MDRLRTSGICGMGSAYDDADVGRLTPGQKDCLRLVMGGYKTKEIAHRLGIGIDAVNKRLAAAKTTLGSPSRFHAARRLASHEAATSYHSAVGGVSPIVSETKIVKTDRGGACSGTVGGESPSLRKEADGTTSSDLVSASGEPDVDAGHGTALPIFAALCLGAFAIAAVVGALLRVLTRG